MSDKNYKMHVISGTHWDREWRHTSEQSKPRLVELVDTMMDVLEKNEDYKAFCLDGGMVVLEDYFTVRPENYDRLSKLIKDGRVQLVNWYTLPETFTVAPEALIRNIQKGQQMADEFGGAIDSGYTATGYGQTSQLPQIYKGFDINSAIFYRGTTKHTLEPLFEWEGKDGTKIYTLRAFDEVTRTNWFFYVHQPLVTGKPPRTLGYEYNPEHIPSHMCDQEYYVRAIKLLREEYAYNKDPEALKKALEDIKEQAAPYVIGNHYLAMNLEDNDVPFPLLPEMIKDLNEVSDDIEIVQDTLDEYMEKIIEESKQRNLPVHQGELRYTAVEPGFNGLLGATHSSRMKLKIKNEEVETKLLYHAEPLASVFYMMGGEYPQQIMKRAWRHLLLNHAHDSICGAAVDQAHEDMMYNFSVAQTVAEEITSRSVEEIYKKIDTVSDFQQDDHTIVLFNNLPFARKKVVQLVIDLPKFKTGGDMVDPCSGIGAEEDDREIDFFDIVDSSGNKIDYTVISKDDIKMAIDRKMDTSGIKSSFIRRRILLHAEVPAMGYAAYALRPREREYAPHPQIGEDRKLLARDGILENENIKVQVNSNGTFSMLDKKTGHKMDNLHYFTDNGEVGSAHLSSVPQRGSVQTSLGEPCRISISESNGLRGVICIETQITIPAGATAPGDDRLTEQSVVPITTWLTLEKESEYLKIKTKLTNNARDHRLRVNFPTNIYTDYADVENAFAVDKRTIKWEDTKENWEGFYPFNPMQNFVDVSDGKIGLAVLNKGIREYEVKDDPQRTVAITLLRTHRAYMTANSDMTPEELEKHRGQHSLGTLEYEYALFPHKGDWHSANVLQKAYDHKVQTIAIHALPYSTGELPSCKSFFEITPSDRIMVSALTQSSDGKAVLLRVWNSSDEKADVQIKTPFSDFKASRVQLNEKHIEEIKNSGGTVKFEIRPHGIETLRFEK
ncbi:alpha-mannosidase [Sedimentisphaera salicampi]|uniref:alpha-mannosidase n=1 Tax=Sedimentisphaera salicampi TaxID=1941349 RepID=UPI000B9B01BE|nr:glycoside hydrolase family 38 C-terminal domain-containing protein [Sedimentisphaera salicampi]OXU15962.1 Mannosylglycerate hydrolase [Sedimentisphaera salicampi]